MNALGMSDVQIRLYAAVRVRMPKGVRLHSFKLPARNSVELLFPQIGIEAWVVGSFGRYRYVVDSPYADAATNLCAARMAYYFIPELEKEARDGYRHRPMASVR